MVMSSLRRPRSGQRGWSRSGQREVIYAAGKKFQEARFRIRLAVQSTPTDSDADREVTLDVAPHLMMALGASGRPRGSLPAGLALDQPQQFVDLVFGQRIGFNLEQNLPPCREVGEGRRSGHRQRPFHFMEQIKASPFYSAERHPRTAFNEPETQLGVVPNHPAGHAGAPRLR